MKKIVISTLMVGSLLFAVGFNDGIDALNKGNDLKAYQTFTSLAQNGDIDAQVMLGSMYLDGVGVKIDHKKALFWLEKAAQNGDAEALYLLGFMYENGLGVESNDKLAAQYYEKASKAGDILAQLNLAIMYKEGRGVSKDMKMAFMWLEKANQTKQNLLKEASL